MYRFDGRKIHTLTHTQKILQSGLIWGHGTGYWLDKGLAPNSSQGKLNPLWLSLLTQICASLCQDVLTHWMGHVSACLAHGATPGVRWWTAVCHLPIWRQPETSRLGCRYSACTWRNNDVIMTSSRRRFDVTMTLFSRHVHAGNPG